METAMKSSKGQRMKINIFSVSSLVDTSKNLLNVSQRWGENVAASTTDTSCLDQLVMMLY